MDWFEVWEQTSGSSVNSDLSPGPPLIVSSQTSCKIKCYMSGCFTWLVENLQSPCCFRFHLSSLISLVKRDGASLYLHSLIQYHVAHVLYSSHTVSIRFSISLFIYFRLLGFALRNCMQLSNGTGKESWSCFGLSQCKCSYSPRQRSILTEQLSCLFLLTVFNLLMEPTLYQRWEYIANLFSRTDI